MRLMNGWMNGWMVREVGIDKQAYLKCYFSHWADSQGILARLERRAEICLLVRFLASWNSGSSSFRNQVGCIVVDWFPRISG